MIPVLLLVVDLYIWIWTGHFYNLQKATVIFWHSKLGGLKTCIAFRSMQPKTWERSFQETRSVWGHVWFASGFSHFCFSDPVGEGMPKWWCVQWIQGQVGEIRGETSAATWWNGGHELIRLFQLKNLLQISRMDSYRTDCWHIAKFEDRTWQVFGPHATCLIAKAWSLPVCWDAWYWTFEMSQVYSIFRISLSGWQYFGYTLESHFTLFVYSHLFHLSHLSCT